MQIVKPQEHQLVDLDCGGDAVDHKVNVQVVEEHEEKHSKVLHQLYPHQDMVVPGHDYVRLQNLTLSVDVQHKDIGKHLEQENYYIHEERHETRFQKVDVQEQKRNVDQFLEKTLIVVHCEVGLAVQGQIRQHRF